MPPAVIVMTVFGAGVLGTAAVWMLLRDLLARPAGAATLPLRRVPTVADELPAGSLLGKFDQTFERLVLEGGAVQSSTAAVLGMLTLGIAVGGGLYLWLNEPFAAISGAALGMIAGLVWMSVMRARRMRSILEAMPYVLDLMSRAVRAGESVDQAIALVGNETAGPIGEEFRHCARQLDMGMSLPTVLRGLARRVRIPEVRLMSVVLSVNREAGGNVALTLERMSYVIRDRINFQRQMRATTGAGRFSARMISVVGPLLFIFMFFLQREHLQPLLSDPLGQMMLVTGMILEVIGIVWVMQLLKTDR